MAISKKHKRFADLYHHSKNGTLSYQEVYGCKPKTAAAAAYKLLKRDDIKSYLERLEERKLEVAAHHAVITDNEVLIEETKLIRRRIPEIFDENGDLKDLKDWSPELQDAVAEIEMVKVVADYDEDGRPIEKNVIKKIKFESKGQALGRIEKVKGMIVDKHDHEHHGTFDIRAILADIDGLNRNKLPQDCD